MRPPLGIDGRKQRILQARTIASIAVIQQQAVQQTASRQQDHLQPQRHTGRAARHKEQAVQEQTCAASHDHPGHRCQDEPLHHGGKHDEGFNEVEAAHYGSFRPAAGCRIVPRRMHIVVSIGTDMFHAK
jgi:hypothetical protein